MREEHLQPRLEGPVEPILDGQPGGPASFGGHPGGGKGEGQGRKPPPPSEAVEGILIWLGREAEHTAVNREQGGVGFGRKPVCVR